MFPLSGCEVLKEVGSNARGNPIGRIAVRWCNPANGSAYQRGVGSPSMRMTM